MGVFEAAHTWEEQKGPLSKICLTYPSITKLGLIMPYLKKIQKIYESRDPPFEFC